MMAQFRYFTNLLVLGLLVSACASGLSKDECRVADWRAIGYEDGVQGWPESRVGEHRKACAEHGIALNLDAYRNGWDDGVRRYCQPGNGYRQGRMGNQYAGVCPSDLEAEFLHAYGHGRELYGLESKVRHTARTLGYKRNRLAEIETELRDTGIELVSADIPVERRVVLLDEIRRLEEERSATKAAIPSLEAKLHRQKRRLAELSANSAY